MADLKELRQRVTILDVIGHYGISLKFKNGRKGQCPLPSHSKNSAHNDSFSITHEDGAGGFACHSTPCQNSRYGTTKGKPGGSIFDFVMEMERVPIEKAGELIAEWFPANGNRALKSQVATSKPEPEPAPTRNLLLSEVHPGFTKLKDLDFGHEWLAKRGLNRDTCEYFGVGYFPGRSKLLDQHRIAIPLHNLQGELLGFLGRAHGPIPEGGSKFKFPPGYHAHLEMWNAHRVVGHYDTVVLVEGPFDVMMLNQNDCENAMAFVGTNMSKEQEALITANFDTAILMMDGDAPGREAADKIAARLVHSMLVRVIDLEEGQDPDNLTADQIHSLGL